MKPRHSTRSRRRAFTLLETLFGMTLVTLVMASSTGIYFTSLRVGSKAVDQSVTSQDAATAVVLVETALREARRFELMEGGNWGSDYLARNAAGDPIAVAGIHIVFPAARGGVSIVTDSAGQSVSLSGANALVDAGTDGAYLDVYRSDAAGHPRPSDGTHLWAKGHLNGGPLPSQGISLCDNIASWCGAVQFIQPNAPGTDIRLKNQVRLKITTGKWDRTHQAITSDSSRGVVTSLTGEHVYLRNHDPYGAFSSAAHGQTQYTGGGH